MSRPLSPAAQAVRLPLDQIMGKLHQYSRISFSATDTLPITIETNEAGLQALIDALFAAALRTAADQFLIRPDVERSEYSILMRVLDGRFRAIAAELENSSPLKSTH